jgi:hypothetical protein
MTLAIKIIKRILFLYIAVLLLLTFAQGFLIFSPWATTALTIKETPLESAAQEMVVKAADLQETRSWYIPPQDDQKPIIIFFHGNATHALNGFFRPQYFSSFGYGFVMAEYRGYGGNDGWPSEKGVYADARAQIQYIQRRFPQAPIVLYGESIGTGVAVQMATEFSAKALILEAPFTSVTDVAKKQYPVFPVDLLLMHRFENEKKIAHVNTPLLVIHGRKDTLVPYDHSVALYSLAQYPKKLLTLDDTGHNNIHEGSWRVMASISSFIQRQAQGKDKGSDRDRENE